MKNVCSTDRASTNRVSTDRASTARSLSISCIKTVLGITISFASFNLILVGQASASPQTATPKETPDPYFNNSIKPRLFGDSASSPKEFRTNPQTATKSLSSDFEIVLPNSSAPGVSFTSSTPTFETANIGGGFNPDRKPIRGPVVQTPLEPVELWITPKTPSSRTANQIAPVSHISNLDSSKSLASNDFGTSPGFTVSPSKQLNPNTPQNSIIREASPLESNSFNPQAFQTQQPTSQSFAPPAIKMPNSLAQADSSFATSQKNENEFGGNAFASNAPANRIAKSNADTNGLKFDSGVTNNFTQTPVAAVTQSPNAQAAFAQDTRTNVAFNNPVDDRRSNKKSFKPSKVLALVAGEPIFVGDLMFEINQLVEKFLAGAPEDVKERERQKMIPKILPKFVESKLLFHGMLSELPDEVPVDKVLEQAEGEFDDKALEPMMKNSGLKSVAEFDAHLRAQGSSLRNLRRSWSRDQLTKYFLGQQLQVKSEVTHQQMLDEYRKNFATYETKGKARWEQIVVRFDRSDSASAAKRAISQLGDQVVYGANFSATAKKGSHGFMAGSGGQHDWTSRGALVLKEIDDAIFSLPVGELSDIIQTSNGYHIVRVIERTEEGHVPFLEAQVEIKKRIIDEQRKEAFDKHLAKLRKEIPVEYMIYEPEGLSSN